MPDLITEGRQEWDALQPYDEWGPLSVEQVASREDPPAPEAEEAPSIHTHDGSGSASTIVGGVEEEGSTVPTASGTASVAVGDGAVASAIGTVVVGAHDGSGAAAPTASDTGCIAIGSGHTSSSNDGPQATGVRSIAIGSGGNTTDGARATGSRTVSIGTGSEATGSDSTSLGHQADATGTQTTALGASADASATSATAVGYDADATHQESTALGAHTDTTKANQVILGRDQDVVTHPGGVEYRVVVETGTALTGSRFHAIVIGNNGTGLTYTLPAAIGSGQRLVVKNVNATNMTVATNASGTQDNIDGSTSNRTLAQYEVLEVVDYATDNWALLHLGAP